MAASTSTMVEYGDDFVFDWSIKGSLSDLKILTGEGSISSENLKSPGSQNIWQMTIDDSRTICSQSQYYSSMHTSYEPVKINLKLLEYGHPSFVKKRYGYRYEINLTYEDMSSPAGKIEEFSKNTSIIIIDFKFPEMTLPLYSFSNKKLNFKDIKNVRIKGRIQSEPQIVTVNNLEGKKVREIKKPYGCSKIISVNKEGKILSKILEEYHPGDIEVVCKEEKFKIHKYLLIAQSEVFAKMFEVDLSEKQKNQIVIEDFEPEIVQFCLNYLKNISKQSESVIENELENFGWEKTREIFKMSHKYEIDDLKSQCEAMLCQNIDFMSAIEMLELGKIYDLNDLKESAMTFIWNWKRSPEILKALEDNPELYVEIQSEFWKKY